MPWNVPRMWEGGECYIIGGGTSMPRQFNVPKLLIEEVVSGKKLPDEYSPYLSLLHNRHVIGVNAAYTIGNWIDICFFGDMGFFNKHMKQLVRFPGLKVSCNSVVQRFSWVKFLKQSRVKGRGIAPRNTEVVWGLNSGAAAINLAVHTGAKRIVLLGFDMKLDEHTQSHWHGLYKKRTPKDLERSFNKHLRIFPAIAKDAKKMGIEILNANPDSGLQVFKKVKLEDVL